MAAVVGGQVNGGGGCAFGGGCHFCVLSYAMRGLVLNAWGAKSREVFLRGVKLRKIFKAKLRRSEVFIHLRIFGASL